jgi:hypothetical protein
MVRGPNARPSSRVQAGAILAMVPASGRFNRSELAGRVLLPFDWLATIFAAWIRVFESQGSIA